MRHPFLSRPRALGAALVAAFALATAGPARAGFVTATFDTVSPGEVVTITSGTTFSATGWAGVYQFKGASGDLTGNFGGFCIDIAQDIYGGTTVTFNVQDLSGAPMPGSAMGDLRANLIRELWAADYAKIGTSNQNAAAFQLAIWEIINETSTTSGGALNLNVTSGSFRATDSGDPGALTVANSWLAALDLSGNGAKDNLLMALTSTKYQDYVTEVPAAAVPAPPGVVLAGVALCCGGLAAGWRRLRQRPGALPS